MSNETRQPAGVPTGGQFAVTGHPETTTTLSEPAAPDLRAQLEALLPATEQPEYVTYAPDDAWGNDDDLASWAFDKGVTWGAWRTANKVRDVITADDVAATQDRMAVTAEQIEHAHHEASLGHSGLHGAAETALYAERFAAALGVTTPGPLPE